MLFDTDSLRGFLDSNADITSEEGLHLLQVSQVYHLARAADALERIANNLAPQEAEIQNDFQQWRRHVTKCIDKADMFFSEHGFFVPFPEGFFDNVHEEANSDKPE